MVSADTPIFFAKACELFISELAVRSWLHAEQCKRHTIRRTDVAGAICHSNVLDFLLEILHAEELQVYSGSFFWFYILRSTLLGPVSFKNARGCKLVKRKIRINTNARKWINCQLWFEDFNIFDRYTWDSRHFCGSKWCPSNNLTLTLTISCMSHILRW